MSETSEETDENQIIDVFQYDQYSSAIRSGVLSQDALKRIIKHDKIRGLQETLEGLARIKVLEDCENCLINVKKLYDEKGDYFYGDGWPLPLETKPNSRCTCGHDNI